MSVKAFERANPSSCWNKAAEDEPVFVLRSNDELAPDLVEAWAKEYFLRKSAEQDGKLSSQQIAKYEEALQLAKQMRIWRKIHP